LTFSGPAAGSDTDACFSAIYALKEHRLDDAIALYTRCIDQGNLTGENLIVAHNDRGNAYGKRGNYEKALEDFNKVIELNPNDPDAWYNRGLTYKHLGKLDAALRDYHRAISLKPDYAKAFNNRGTIYGRQARFQKAIEDFDQAIALAPEDAGAWFNRGLAWYSLGEYERAIPDLEKAIELNPDYLKAYKNLAWLRATCPDPALRDGKAAVALAKKARFLMSRGTADLYEILAAAHATAGQLDDAVRYEELAIEAAPRHATAMSERLQRYKRGQSWNDAGGNRFL